MNLIFKKEKKSPKNKPVLIFDLGHGTLDVDLLDRSQTNMAGLENKQLKKTQKCLGSLREVLVRIGVNYHGQV
jgi:molecular chaperone DnaK (HSP70)